MKHAKHAKREQGPKESGVHPRARPLKPAVVAANEALVEALVEADRAHEQAEQREHELREIAEFRERLIGIVGHDLRNPLNAIMLAANLLANSKNTNAAERETVQRIANSSQRMRKIIAQLVDFTRARLGGGFPLSPTRLHLPTVVARVADELRLVTGRTIIVHEQGDLDGEWDAERLGATFSNLLSNAVEHALPGTPIEVALMGEGDLVTCDVTNLGKVIPPDVLHTLFEPFRQLDPLAHRESGNVGLGLYIAHEIVRAHGGVIRAASANGRTTFTFELPRKTPASSE